MFEKERPNVLTISTISLSFHLLPCPKFPSLFPNHAFSNAHFSRVGALEQGKPPLYFVVNYVLLSAVKDAQCNTEETPQEIIGWKFFRG